VLGCLVSALVVPATSAAAAETVKVKFADASIVANGTSTTTVTAVVTNSAGVRVTGHTIAFTASDSGVKFGATSEKANGAYVATLTSSTVAGTVIISATDQSVTPPAAGDATLPQTAGPASAIGLTLSPNSIVANGNSYTTATATVADAHGNPVTADKVAFSSSDPGQVVENVTNSGNGTYSALIKSSTTPGSSTITATDSSAKLSAVASLTETLSGSNLSLAAFPSAVVTNQSVTLLAAVTSSPGPSGTVTFADGGHPIAGCAGEPISPSTPAATCTTSFAASTSPEAVTADFTPNSGSGLANATGSTTVTVGPDSTSTSLDASNTTGVGESTTYTATVQPPASRSGPVEPGGTVEFLDGGQPIQSCMSQPLSAGGAVCTVSYGSQGTHSITARYSGDANFAGSTSTSSTVSVVPVPADVAGIIAATMQWTFTYAPSFTKVLALVVNGLPPNATVSVTCHGRGCPIAKRLASTARSKRCQTPQKNGKCSGPKTVDLTPAFKNRLLRAGTRISVKISRPGWIGKSYTFTARAARRPTIQIACMAPGATHPSSGC
jgi:adhesin/invasin